LVREQTECGGAGHQSKPENGGSVGGASCSWEKTCATSMFSSARHTQQGSDWRVERELLDGDSMTAAQESDFVSAFDWAVVRLATYFPASASEARLLFGSVSLLTKDRPRPSTSKGADSHKVGNGKSGKVFFRRTVLGARDAIAWYRGAGTDGITTPIPTEPSEVEKKKDGLALSPNSFEDDPQWPSLGVF
jgi:hypothetical protein